MVYIYLQNTLNSYKNLLFISPFVVSEVEPWTLNLIKSAC